MHARSSNSEAVSDAMEMAVLSSVQHPNIVQVFSCLTDMVYLEDGARPVKRGQTRPKAVKCTAPVKCSATLAPSPHPAHSTAFPCRTLASNRRSHDGEREQLPDAERDVQPALPGRRVRAAAVPPHDAWRGARGAELQHHR
jgi:hypothetical protein